MTQLTCDTSAWQVRTSSERHYTFEKGYGSLPGEYFWQCYE
ncbi:MAG: hypothetical protein AB9903_22900 [Vulcanimicrobiota bacterium]